MTADVLKKDQRRRNAMNENMRAWVEKDPVIAKVAACQETVWINPSWLPYEEVRESLSVTDEQIQDAEDRLRRFAPFIMKCFPETADQGGLIESPLTEIPKMQETLRKTYGAEIPGRLFLKQDSHLAIAGSIKARGGIYEVLKHTEDLAIEHGILKETDDYSKLSSDECRAFFSRYTVAVGSTGNLGLSIGIMSAAVGFHVVVHMSTDAKQWKKDLLRSRGVEVIEYASDYSRAVEEGRKLSDADPNSYFVDDEKSVNLFLGYAVAAKRLRDQLKEQGITIGEAHPLIVYLPCGVGGAPGGVGYGLKRIFGDHVHCFFVEPVMAPCMVLGMATGLHEAVCVQDFDISGVTHADGLAVGRPSGFVGRIMNHLVSGEFTIDDAKLYDHLRELNESERIQIEPSSCAAFAGPVHLMEYEDSRDYVKAHLGENASNCIQIAWATGGRLVPEENRKEYLETYL